MLTMFMPVMLLLTSLATFVSAVPLALRDVVDPPITSPTANTVWHVGEQQTVTWNTTGLPSNPSNPNGMLVLGYMYNNSENLMLDSPLATNLNYSTGQAQITVPNVSTREDYIVVLFGDSGNASPQFTIINDASSSTTPTPSPTSTPIASTPTAPPSSPSPSPSSSGSTPPPSPPAPSGSNPTTGPSSGSPSPTQTPTTTPPSPTLVENTSNTLLTVTASTTSATPAQTNAAGRVRALSVGEGTAVSVGLVLGLSVLQFVF
ncbi:hypothetical protein F5I97DRAFT_1881208 [Phlebopus sp. FC_14]|nr:hypothetical protein F5I97DRAFT_1881208 [Phlebopus sp. FC_14]